MFKRLMRGGKGVEPDGDYVSETSAKLLKEGRFHRGIRLLVGQTAAEVGPILTRSFLPQKVPGISL